MSFKEKKYKCKNCNGTGRIDVEPEESKHINITFSDTTVWNTCPVCWGEGELDWIENIKGKQFDPFRVIAFDLVRSIHPSTIAADLISVKPMDKPTTKYFVKARFKEDEEDI